MTLTFLSDSELFEKGVISRGIPLDWLLPNVERVHSVVVRQSPDLASSTSLLFNLYNPNPWVVGKSTSWVYSGDYYYSINFSREVPLSLISSYLRVLFKGVRGVEIDWFELKEYTFNDPNFPPLDRPNNSVTDNLPGQFDAVLGGNR